MGRKTFESIGRALPKRTNIVITRDASALQGRVPETVAVVNSLEQAVERARGAEIPGREEVFVIGGGEIYRQAISRVDRIYITRIDEEYAGDAFFPEFKWEDFREISRERHEARESDVSPHHGGHDADHSIRKTSATIPAFDFIVLERR
jgi:dihydrofolate reductase